MRATILIVDDSLTVRMDLADALDSAGFRAIGCGTVGEAREALASEPVALVILDVLLPDGDGVDFLGELRASPRGALPIMLLSTETEVRDRVRGLAKGADDYVGKPYDASYVVARTHELVRRRAASESPPAPTVLVIDDSLTFREELRRVLVEEGYQVILAASGEEGLRVAADVRPSAIIVDGVLPGIPGATVVGRLRLDAALRQTPCLMLTASEQEGAELGALDAGADAFVRKDCELAVVLARLSAILRGAGPPASRSTASLLGPKRILAVDDSPTYLHGIADALRRDGYDVVLAGNGEEALELLRFQAVDCILLDLVMPGLGGEETCRRIKATPRTRDLPLVILTSLEAGDAVIRGLGAGADDYISKSSDFAVLKARVLAQIRRKQFEDENRSFREELMRKELEASEARAARALAETRAALLSDVERKNRELEAFSYSVSHDLRAPLRSIDGFSQMLLADYHDKLDEQGREYLRRVCAAAESMSQLIDAMLELARVTRADLRRQRVSLSRLASAIAAALRATEPERQAEFVIAEGLEVQGDPHLLRAVLENLLGNAWKFTARKPAARIEVGATRDAQRLSYFVRDNGAGFDMTYAGKLFAPFARLHSSKDFKGTGIGLATVHRIVDRHGGRIWAEGAVGEGAAFHFTLATELTEQDR